MDGRLTDPELVGQLVNRLAAGVQFQDFGTVLRTVTLVGRPSTLPWTFVRTRPAYILQSPGHAPVRPMRRERSASFSRARSQVE